MFYNKTVLARSLRKESTVEEQKVWKFLRNRKFHNLKFRRQHVISGFVVDFYCDELKLAIEIDGKVHEKQKEYDECRQMLIELKGISFIRITNEEINNNIELLLDKITAYADTLLPVGEGPGVRA